MRVTSPLAGVLPSEALSDAYDGPWLEAGAMPEAVVHPDSAEEVAATLQWAAASGVAVLPIGTGRHRSRPWPNGRYLVMTTRRRGGVQVYEPADLTLTAGAGTGLGELDAEVRAHRQWLPFDPPDAPGRTLGGLVASGASGPLRTGYGELRNHVLGMTVVCGDGRTLELGGRVVKNVAGFDMLKPWVGSQGRLGVITSVCLRTFPVPATDALVVLGGDSAASLVEAALAVGTAPVVPASSSIIEPATAFGRKAALVVRLHGAERTVEADRVAIELHAGVPFDIVADGAAMASVRDHASSGEVVLNVTVRPSRLAEALAAIADLLDVEVAADTYAASVRVSASALGADQVERLREHVAALGGAVSVASGGRELMAESSVEAPEVRELSERLTRVFDPNGVLWSPRP